MTVDKTGRPLNHVVDPKTGLPIGREVGFSAGKRPMPTTLTGRDVTLVPLDPGKHGDALFEGTHGDDRQQLWLYMGEGPFADRSSFQTYLEKRASADDSLIFAIIDNATRLAAGHAAYMRVKPTHCVIEVGNIVYTSTIARKAGGTEAMFLMARHAFEDLGYQRYEWKCNALNAPSCRAALRLGFTFEGIFPQHMIQKGRSRDTAWFSMLAGEWPSRKSALERWSLPSNFDANGKQKKDLATLRKEIRSNFHLEPNLRSYSAPSLSSKKQNSEILGHVCVPKTSSGDDFDFGW
jgi:RimJ/RimL family protein N-acetyltransferase